MTRATPARSAAKTRKKPGGAQPKRPCGRPPKYRPEFAERATDLCLLGATNDELAKVLGVDTRTISDWLVTRPEFSHAIKQGRELADAEVSRALYRKATGTWTQPAVKIVTKIEILPDGTGDQGRAHRALRRALPARHRRRLHLAQEPSAPPLARQEGGPAPPLTSTRPKPSASSCHPARLPTSRRCAASSYATMTRTTARRSWSMLRRTPRRSRARRSLAAVRPRATAARPSPRETARRSTDG